MLEVETKLTRDFGDLRRSLGSRSEKDTLALLQVQVRSLCRGLRCRELRARAPREPRFQIWDRYYDTQKLDLKHRHMSLRERWIVGTAVLTLKIPLSRRLGRFAREELTFKLDADRRGTLEGRCVVDIAAGSELKSLSSGDLRVLRDATRVFARRKLIGQVDIENTRLALDYEIDPQNFFAVYFDRFRTTDQVTGESEKRFEVELEYILSDDRQAFETVRALSRKLQEDFCLQHSRESKYEHALRLRE